MEAFLRGHRDPLIISCLERELERSSIETNHKLAQLYQILRYDRPNLSGLALAFLWYWADVHPDETEMIRALSKRASEWQPKNFCWVSPKAPYFCDTIEELKTTVLVISRNAPLKILQWALYVAIVKNHIDFIDAVSEIMVQESSFMRTNAAHHYKPCVIDWDCIEPNTFKMMVRTFPWYFASKEDWSIRCTKFDSIDILRSFSADVDYNPFPLSKIDIKYFLVGLNENYSRYDANQYRSWVPIRHGSLFPERVEYVIGLQHEFRLHDYIRYLSSTEDPLYILLSNRLPDYIPEPGELQRWRKNIAGKKGRISSGVLEEAAAHLGICDTRHALNKTGRLIVDMINELALRE